LRAGLNRAVAHHAAEHHAAQALQVASCSSCPIQLSPPPAVLLLATSEDPEVPLEEDPEGLHELRYYIDGKRSRKRAWRA